MVNRVFIIVLRVVANEGNNSLLQHEPDRALRLVTCG
jgi:hypothetical protein